MDLGHSFFKSNIYSDQMISFAFTFGSVSVSEGTDDLPDAVFRADAVRSHVSSFNNLCCGDVCVRGFCGESQTY